MQLRLRTKLTLVMTGLVLLVAATLSVFKRPDGSPMTVPPRRLLAHELVRFAGEAVAAVVATSRVAAQTAAEAIAVDYEVLPSVVDPLEATKPGAPTVWADAPDNIVAAMSYGDAAKVEAAFASAATPNVADALDAMYK